jgi:hypothetical protein
MRGQCLLRAAVLNTLRLLMAASERKISGIC